MSLHPRTMSGVDSNGPGGYYEGQYWALARAGATGRRKVLTGTRVSVKAEGATVDETDEAGGVLYALANGKNHGRGKRVWASGARCVLEV